MSAKSGSRPELSRNSGPGGKKHPVRTRYLAGEPVNAPELSQNETRIFSTAFAEWPCKGENPSSPIGISAAVMRRREAAAKACWPYFREHFARSCPPEDIAGALAAAISFPVRFAEWFTEPDFIALGAAYWILDRLEAGERMDRLQDLLPHDVDQDDELLPFIEDLTHSRHMVERLVQLLRERKTHPEAFRGLTDLIGEQNTAQCRAAFRDALTDYFGRFLEVRTRIRPVLDEPAAKVPYSLSPVPTAKKLFDTETVQPPRVFTEKDSWRWPPDLHFLWMTPTLIGASVERMKEAMRYRRMIDLMSGFTVRDPYEICAAWILLEGENDLLVELNTLSAAVIICAERHLPWYYEEGEMCIIPTNDTQPDYRMKYLFHPPESASEEETDDDPALSSGETAEASPRPSGEESSRPSGEESPRLSDGESPRLSGEESPRPSGEESPRPSGGVEIDGQYYAPYVWENEAGSMIEQGRLLSEAQLFYLVTGYLLPRRNDDRSRMETWFVRQGITPERARELSFGATLLSHVWPEDMWEWEYLSRDDAPEESDTHSAASGTTSNAAASGTTSNTPARSGANADQSPAPGQHPDAVSHSAADTKKIAELTRQLKATRQALHDAEQMARQIQERALEEEKRSMRDRMELSGLRETLFRMKAGEGPEEQSAAGEVEFPWPVKRRVLVFGGHDTWSKAIRPLLPAVRFFDREALPDLKAIKGADAVWIQSNALSHKFYYRIIDTARKENIPVLYFGFASARKCAEQLVANEMEAEEN